MIRGNPIYWNLGLQVKYSATTAPFNPMCGSTLPVAKRVPSARPLHASRGKLFGILHNRSGAENT
jgi:hypothetical protein